MGKNIITQKRGAARPRYTSPSHRHVGDVHHPSFTGDAFVVDLIHAPGRSTPVAVIQLPDGRRHLALPTEGLRVGNKIRYTTESTIEPGHTTVVSKIPEGTPIFNIEGAPGDGGKFVRAAGSYATIVSHNPDGTVVSLRSGSLKKFHPLCRATVGNVAGGGRGEKPWLKAGKKFYAMRTNAKKWPIVRGVAMNPVSHPHGGGSHNFSGGPTSVKRGTPPRANVGKIAPKRTGRRKV
jgi:large subunit ribosomal protein L2